MSEMSFLLSLQALHGTFFDSIMMAATRVGNAGEIWIALAAVLLCSKKTPPGKHRDHRQSVRGSFYFKRPSEVSFCPSETLRH